jgi:hypothetical protein
LEFKFGIKKIKKSGKLCKKTRSNSKNIGGEFFLKSQPFYWIKFKLNQKYKNGSTRPLLTYILFGLPDSSEQRSRLFPFRPVESGGEIGWRGKKSAMAG